jgi:hypothetical protein
MDLTSIGKKLTDATTALAKADKDLKLEMAGAAADAAGIIDPSPASDIVGAGISIARGDYWGAALSTASMVPYVGDLLAKPAKAVRATKAIAGLEKKVAALTKTVTDLKKAKKEAEAVEAAAKKAELAKEADIAKGVATKQEKQSAKTNKDCEDCNTSVAKRKKLTPGTSEHKVDRWQKYQDRGGKNDYARWSKQYDINMRNFKYGAEREEVYRKAMGATEGTLKTPLTNRQIDILNQKDLYAGQLKTGRVSLTKENIIAISKDAELVKRGWAVEHILEKGASKPYLEALEKAGIDYVIKPKF